MMQGLAGTQRMCILYVTTLADRRRGGGVEQTLGHLCRLLTDRGHRCVTLSVGEEGGLHKVVEDGVTSWTVAATGGYWQWSASWNQRPPPIHRRQIAHALTTFNPFIQETLRSVIDNEKPDLVSFHNLPVWSVVSWKTAAKSGRPALQTLHDHFPICFNQFMRRAYGNCETQCLHCRIRRFTSRRYSRYLTGVVGISQYILDRHVGLNFFTEVPVKRVIHNARDPGRLGLGSGTNRQIKASGLRFGYIGRLDPFKGIEVLLDAFVAADIPAWELWLAGSGSEDHTRALQRRVQDKRVRWLGRVEARDFYPDIDVLVVPTLCNEPLGNVVFEGLAFGKPVLGARRGGIPEMLKDGVNGLLFDPENPTEFVTVLRRIAEDKGLREALGQAAHGSAEYFLDTDRWVAQYEDVYNAVIETHRLRS